MIPRICWFSTGDALIGRSTTSVMCVVAFVCLRLAMMDGTSSEDWRAEFTDETATPIKAWGRNMIDPRGDANSRSDRSIKPLKG